MSVVGVDFGTLNTVIAVARNRGVGKSLRPSLPSNDLSSRLPNHCPEGAAALFALFPRQFSSMLLLLVPDQADLNVRSRCDHKRGTIF